MQKHSIPHDKMLKLLCDAYPCLRNRIVAQADEWITDDCQFLYYGMLASLSSLLVERLSEGNYDHVDTLFAKVEEILENGTQPVKDLIATGFLEGMQNQTILPHENWAPLLGPLATDFCHAMDKFHGTKTHGLRTQKA